MYSWNLKTRKPYCVGGYKIFVNLENHSISMIENEVSDSFDVCLSEAPEDAPEDSEDDGQT